MMLPSTKWTRGDTYAELSSPRVVDSICLDLLRNVGFHAEKYCDREGVAGSCTLLRGRIHEKIEFTDVLEM